MTTLKKIVLPKAMKELHSIPLNHPPPNFYYRTQAEHVTEWPFTPPNQWSFFC